MRKLIFNLPFNIFIALAIMILGVQKSGFACTIWAAAGKSVLHQGTLIAKNRDWYPGQAQRLKFVKYHKKFSYIALFADDGAASSIKAGVNEHGLVIVNAAASQITLRKKPYARSLMGKLLSRCMNIPDALSHPDWFHGSRFLLLADSRKIALVEIGKGGVFKVKTIANGKLCHTNHYVEPELEFLNPNPNNRSSLSRLRLIKKGLAAQKKYSFMDFITMSGINSETPGPSLWRNGKTPVAVRTLATWIVWQPYGGKPTLFVRLTNPRQKEQEYYFDLNKAFGDRRLKAESIPQIYGYAATSKPNLMEF